MTEENQIYFIFSTLALVFSAGVWDFLRGKKELSPEEEEDKILRELERTSLLDYAKQEEIVNRLRANKARQRAQQQTEILSDGQTQANPQGSPRTERIKCGYCKGEGHYICFGCNGTGRNNQMLLTPKYTGNSKVDALLSIQHRRDSLCSSCDGKREVICPKCGGSRFQQ